MPILEKHLIITMEYKTLHDVLAELERISNQFKTNFVETGRIMETNGQIETKNSQIDQMTYRDCEGMPRQCDENGSFLDEDFGREMNTSRPEKVQK